MPKATRRCRRTSNLWRSTFRRRRRWHAGLPRSASSCAARAPRCGLCSSPGKGSFRTKAIPLALGWVHPGGGSADARRRADFAEKNRLGDLQHEASLARAAADAQKAEADRIEAEVDAKAAAETAIRQAHRQSFARCRNRAREKVTDAEKRRVQVAARLAALEETEADSTQAATKPRTNAARRKRTSPASSRRWT